MAYIDDNGVIQPDYTMLYKDYKAEYGALDLSMFDTVTINGKEFNFADMFDARNQYKEIGCETPEIFKDCAQRRIKEIALIFTDKIKVWSENLSDTLWNREVVHEEKSATNQYLNPVNGINTTTQDNKPELQATTENVYNHHIITGNGISNPVMMEQVMAVRNIYYDALAALDNLFITLY